MTSHLKQSNIDELGHYFAGYLCYDIYFFMIGTFYGPLKILLGS